MLDVFIGFSVGSILLLVALGLAITYGAMGVINMAHGEMVMVGAYTTVLSRVWLGGKYFRRHSACLHRHRIARAIDRARGGAPAVRAAARHPAGDLGHRDPDPTGGTARIRPFVLRHSRRGIGSRPAERGGSSLPPRSVPVAGQEINIYRTFIIVVTLLVTAGDLGHSLPHVRGHAGACDHPQPADGRGLRHRYRTRPTR